MRFPTNLACPSLTTGAKGESTQAILQDCPRGGAEGEGGRAGTGSGGLKAVRHQTSKTELDSLQFM